MCLYGSSETIQIYQKTFPNLLFQKWHPYIANVLQTEVSKSIADFVTKDCDNEGVEYALKTLQII